MLDLHLREMETVVLQRRKQRRRLKMQRKICQKKKYSRHLAHVLYKIFQSSIICLVIAI